MNKRIWMLYDACDLQVNLPFVALMQKAAADIGMQVEAVTTEELLFRFSDTGIPSGTALSHAPLPDLILSRQRNARISRYFEQMGIPVYNNSRVCDICNHKGATHLFLQGLPMMPTALVPRAQQQPSPFPFPVVVKPARGHGGQQVCVAEHAEAYQAALMRIAPDDAVVQPVADGAGRDLRLYVLFGKIICGVLRTAQHGIVSNFKLGGSAALHIPTQAELYLGKQVIERFAAHGAPLCLAGIDLLYHEGRIVVNEVEDVVGCRMLYAVSNLDIAALYMHRLADDNAL